MSIYILLIDFVVKYVDFYSSKAFVGNVFIYIDWKMQYISQEMINT